MRASVILIGLLLLTYQNTTRGTDNDWQVSIQENILLKESSKGEYRKLLFQSHRKIVKDFTAHVLVLQPDAYRVELVDNPSNNLSDYHSVAKLTEEKGAIVGINGGFFTKEFTPNGLFILKGRLLSPIKKLPSPVLAGILRIDESGKVALEAINSYSNLASKD
ncbi:MAG: hypothetical protein AB1489_10620, partial [Acidobacteriota bacterium]